MQHCPLHVSTVVSFCLVVKTYRLPVNQLTYGQVNADMQQLIEFFMQFRWLHRKAID